MSHFRSFYIVYAVTNYYGYKYFNTFVLPFVFQLKVIYELRVAAHACNPATWDVEIEVIVVQDQPGQKN
jgi:hypothetical protein